MFAGNINALNHVCFSFRPTLTVLLLSFLFLVVSIMLRRLIGHSLLLPRLLPLPLFFGLFRPHSLPLSLCSLLLRFSPLFLFFRIVRAAISGLLSSPICGLSHLR